MKTISTPLFPFLEKHSETYLKKLSTPIKDNVSTSENFKEVSQLLNDDALFTPSETSINIVMDYARKKMS